MAKKNPLVEAQSEFQKVIESITIKTSKLLSEQIGKDINSKIFEAVEDEEEEEEVEDTVSVDDEETEAENPIEVDTEDSEESDETETDNVDIEDVVGDTVDNDQEIDLDNVTADDEPEGEFDLEGGSGEGEVDTEVSDVLSDIVDATNLSDTELVRIFKDVTHETNIEVVKNDDNTLSLRNGEEEYIVKLNENAQEKLSFLDSILHNGDEEEEEEEVVVFEIELNEEESTIDESRTHTNGRNQTGKSDGFYKYAKSRLRDDKKGALNESLKIENATLLTEAETLKNEKAQLLTEKADLIEKIALYESATKTMKSQLDEVALLNLKMVYVNRLFCEHATSKKEKMSILERFDNEGVKSGKDVKVLFKTINTELTSNLNENKNINLGGGSLGSTGKSLLGESEKTQNKSPMSEATQRIIHLMGVPSKKA